MSFAANICKLPKVTGPCRARIPRWYFNYKTKRCERFIYGGCRGNKNNFRSLSSCQKKCPGEFHHCYDAYHTLRWQSLIFGIPLCQRKYEIDQNTIAILLNKMTWFTINIFLGKGAELVDGEGITVKDDSSGVVRCRGSLKDLSKNISTFPVRSGRYLS